MFKSKMLASTVACAVTLVLSVPATATAAAVLDTGNYTGVTTGDFFGVGIGNNPLITLEIIDFDPLTGESLYNLSDVSAAYYTAFPPFGLQPVVLAFDGTEINIVSSDDAEFPIVNRRNTTATVDMLTGIITLPWFDEENNFGDTTVLTPIDGQTQPPNLAQFAAVPVPAPALLLVSGIAGFAALRRRRIARAT